MSDSQLLKASCRMALAALLHDLGKFAERAGLEVSNAVLDGNLQLYCKHHKTRVDDPGWFSHRHAAYTGIAIDLLERGFPELVGEDMTPFAPWRDKNADDSLINAAAKHHRPETFLQWVIATADRVASGFEREEFEQYNVAKDETQTRKNHYTARQLTLFEQIHLNGEADQTQPLWRYPLTPLSPGGIFPVEAEGYETDAKDAARQEYRRLWDQFIEALADIPASHSRNLALWLDHFDSLWLCFTQAIPAATAFNVKPEVSLYDHSKATASLTVALWRYHRDRDDESEETREAMKERADWDEKKILLVQGDFSGIQDFIFATGGETRRRAAKLLRGRSFYVSLLTECAALKVLDALSLPSTSQVINAAGKFLIVAPNTDATRKALEDAQQEINDWFLHAYGQSSISLAWLPACCNDFLQSATGESPFRDLMKRLFEQLEETKLRRFRLCGDSPPPRTFEGFLDAFDNTKGVCAIDGHSPAILRLDGERDIWVSELAHDQVMMGKRLATHDRVLLTRERLDHNTLRLPLFGYLVNFTRDEDVTGKFGREAESGNLLRAWDFSLPQDAEKPLWNGYARRHINAYVPRFGEMNEWEQDKYKKIKNGEIFDTHPGEIKTLNHLACDDQWMDEKGQWVGVEALMTLKGDVDNLGLIFQKGLERPTFAKMAALSRQMNAFFAMWLPWVCRNEFPNTYTVFAGGDDFFLIGPWLSSIKLAGRMRREFARYVIGNSEIHFSAGLSITKPGLPIVDLARLADEALDDAKAYNPGKVIPTPKNAVSCYGIPVTWDDFELLMQCEKALKMLGAELGLSTGYLYDLLRYTDMAGEVTKRPENALWYSHFAYRTRRLLEAKVKSGDDPANAEARRKRLQAELAAEIVSSGIERHKTAYKIALFTHLYQQRD